MARRYRSRSGRGVGARAHVVGLAAVIDEHQLRLALPGGQHRAGAVDAAHTGRPRRRAPAVVVVGQPGLGPRRGPRGTRGAAGAAEPRGRPRAAGAARTVERRAWLRDRGLAEAPSAGDPAPARLLSLRADADDGRGRARAWRTQRAGRVGPFRDLRLGVGAKP